MRQLEALDFKGDVGARLEFDGTHWVFPVSGSQVRSRTLDGLVAAVTNARGGGVKVKLVVAEMDLTITGGGR